MSKFYIEENNESVFLTYNKKVIYNKKASSGRPSPNLVDFNFAEKFFYGRVDFQFRPIYFDGTGTVPIKYFNQGAADGSSFGAAAYVVDAFADLSKQFKKTVAAGGLWAGDRFLSNLRIFKAYTSPIDLYAQHLENYMAAMASEFITQRIEVRNFNHFMSNFKTLIQDSARQFPFTMPGFIKSKYCPIHASGLVIEIADTKYFNDHEKIAQFIKSKNWNFFLNACNSYGFMVDKAVPWRLVADIASNEMLAYAARYSTADANTGALIAASYNNTYYKFFNDFRGYLLTLYNRVRPDRIQVVEPCGDGSSRSVYITPPKYTLDHIKKLMPDDVLLKLYCNIRIMEDPNTFEHSNIQKIIKQTTVIANYRSLPEALGIFEKIINQPFDYNGSLSYIKKQIALLEEGTVVFSEPR
jgi:hypothetical protein